MSHPQIKMIACRVNYVKLDISQLFKYIPALWAFVKYFSLMWDIVLLELDGDSIIYQYKKKMLVAQLWSEPTAHSEMRQRRGSHKNRGHFQQKVNKKIP